MILTNCAACAAPLAHDAPRCVRCETRYCSDRCERHDRRRGGHGKICGAIASGGGAEQYHADKKYEEAVAEAVEECAEDTAGQTCYICLEDGSEEGLVRMCACRGAAGFAHVSCLAKQAKILVAEAEENNWDNDRFMPRWGRWFTCRLCEQKYQGVVRCALGWACWKTYLGRPEADEVRILAMNQVGRGLCETERYDEALSVHEADLATKVRLGAHECDLLITRTNLALCLHEVGRTEESLRMKREIFADTSRLLGPDSEDTIIDAINLSSSLTDAELFTEALSLLRDKIPVARRVLGESHDLTLRMRWIYARALYEDDGATLDDLREAVTTLEDAERIVRRVFGGAHPLTMGIEDGLRDARAALRARETPPPSSPSGSV